MCVGNRGGETFVGKLLTVPVFPTLLCRVPYRIDLASPPPDALDRLIQLGALDIESVNNSIAAILPDSVTPEDVALSFANAGVTVSAAVARDDGSVWLLSPRDIRIGNVRIASPEGPSAPDTLRLTDSLAFGTGHHPTTALCIEAIKEALTNGIPDSILDVGTGSGVLALTALMMGVPQAVGVDIDAEALRIAAANSRLNNRTKQLKLVLGGPAAVAGNWPLVVANVLAAPLIEMAPILVRRVRTHGRLILSGIPSSLESEVLPAYQRLGMRHVRSESRAGWTAVVVEASW